MNLRLMIRFKTVIFLFLGYSYIYRELTAFNQKRNFKIFILTF